MTGYELYVFLLCFISFILMVLLFGAMFTIIVAQEIRAIKHGVLDEKITNEYMRDYGKKSPVKVVSVILSVVFSLVMLGVFAWALSVNFADPKVEGPIPVPRVVLSDSMATKYEENTYLEENGLNDQFQTFDLIMAYELPDEFELELYDIVVYEYEDELIVHRIIEIEEPNEKHPDSRLFRLRGDANKYSDKDPVEYSQMKAIYTGKKIPFVGSFVCFMQSPAGYLCIFLMLFGIIVAPILEKLISYQKKKRYKEIGFYTRS